MKFDCIVSNAPYNNGLHEKFEAKYFDICDGQIVWVSPLSFLLGKKQKTKITHQLDKYICDIEQINGNEYFDANIGGTMGITYVNMNKDIIHNSTYIIFDGKKYNKCNEISPTSNDELLTEFKSIIEPLYTKDNLNNHLKLTNRIFPSCGRNRFLELNPDYNSICIKTSTYGAGPNKKDGSFYALYSNKGFNIGSYSALFKDDKKNNKHSIYFTFNSYKECINFTNYVKTDFLRATLIFLKNQNDITIGCLLYCPWFDFSDDIFSKTPTEIDDYLFAKYNISDEIRKHIEDLLPDYYNIRKGRD